MVGLFFFLITIKLQPDIPNRIDPRSIRKTILELNLARSIGANKPTDGNPRTHQGVLENAKN